MKRIDTAIAWMFPTILVEGTPWYSMWVESDRQVFVSQVRLFFPLLAVTYFAHYFFYDVPNQLEPIAQWFQFRAAMTMLALLTWLFYLSKYRFSQFSKVPALLTCWIFCQSQAFVAAIHGLESWVFCFVIVVGCVLALRMSAFHSLIFAGLCIGTQTPVLLDGGIPASRVFTGTIATCVITIIVRSPFMSEIRNFLLNQENIAAQHQIIEMNIEFSERLRSFIPRVIAKRIEQCIDYKRMSVVEASLEVMTPRKCEVACLYSDIRGYTQGSKNLDDFVEHGVIPEVKACSNAVEGYEGIPRKVGDLIFAYFDDAEQGSNLLRAIGSGIEIARLNHDMNKTFSSVDIRRYVLLSSGQAMVGNLGGADSSIEITALGSPVNLLSRIDDVTKEAEISSLLQSGDIIFTNDFSDQLASLVPSISFRTIQLSELGLAVRDFPEVKVLNVLKPSEANRQLVSDAIKSSTEIGFQRPIGASKHIAA